MLALQKGWQEASSCRTGRGQEDGIAPRTGLPQAARAPAEPGGKAGFFAALRMTSRRTAGGHSASPHTRPTERRRHGQEASSCRTGRGQEASSCRTGRGQEASSCRTGRGQEASSCRTGRGQEDGIAPGTGLPQAARAPAEPGGKAGFFAALRMTSRRTAGGHSASPHTRPTGRRRWLPGR